MRKIIYIMFFSILLGGVFMFVMFLSANILYNINNGVSCYDIDIFSFFKDVTIKEILFFIFISLMYFIIIYLRYKDY